MKIESIRLGNFKGFKALEINNIPQLAVFVGVNGSGKTTLFDVFAFLKDALKNNIRQALQKRGGFREVMTKGETGLIKIEIQFRLEIATVLRLVTYRIEIGEEKGRPYIFREILRYKRGRYGSPYHFLDFSKGLGYAITNEEDFAKADEELDREEQKLGAPDIMAIKGLGQFERFKAASAFRNFIENWHVSDFHIAAARPSSEAGFAEHLSATGENLPLVAQYIFEHHPKTFQTVLDKMKTSVPGIESVSAENTVDGRVVLRFQDGAFKDPFIANYVSDGTIKMFAYLLLLHDPAPHPLLCIEEPENQLYPTLLMELLEEFRAYSEKGGQVFVSSHSPDLLNATRPDEVFWLVRKDGHSNIEHASDHVEITSLFKAGELLGYLWKENYFKGSHPG